MTPILDQVLENFRRANRLLETARSRIPQPSPTGTPSRTNVAGRTTTTLHQKVGIPAYFHSDASGDANWAAAAQAGSETGLLGLVVFNPASGPGYTTTYRNGAKRDEYQNRVEQMHAAGADVIGYVTTNYRDRFEGNTVQSEHRFTVAVPEKLVTTRSSNGDAVETGWTTGFGPVQVRSKDPNSDLPTALPVGLDIRTNYFWIAVTPTTGKLATSRTNATSGVSVEITTTGDGTEDFPHHVIGLSRSSENIANVFFEIDEFYARWPSIDGMFFDEMDDPDDLADPTERQKAIDYYEDIFAYMKTKDGKALVVQNPGSGFSESVVHVADTFMAFEGPSSNYVNHKPDWRLNYPAEKFWHAIYACPPDQVADTIKQSRVNNAGYVYVTDQADQVWLFIATYFASEIDAIASSNDPHVTEVRVPHVQEMRPAAAAARLRAVGLEPVFNGVQGPNAWVWRQSPRSGWAVTPGSEVRLQLRTGPVQ